MTIEPWTIGVCSWSMKVRSVPELVSACDQVGVTQVSLACGDPYHANWQEGEALPAAVRATHLQLLSAMVGFPGEDYTTPATIQQTGGFGDPSTRSARLDHFRWAVVRCQELGVSVLTGHAGFFPTESGPERTDFLETLAQAAQIAAKHNITFAMETGQETAATLRQALDELQLPNLKVNFDPANMLLYNMGDPIEAVRLLGPDIVAVHCKDAVRPTTAGQWGQEKPLGHGEVHFPRFLHTLREVGYTGPLVIEREGTDQPTALKNIAHAVSYLQGCIQTLQL